MGALVILNCHICSECSHGEVYRLILSLDLDFALYLDIKAGAYSVPRFFQFILEYRC